MVNARKAVSSLGSVPKGIGGRFLSKSRLFVSLAKQKEATERELRTLGAPIREGEQSSPLKDDEPDGDVDHSIRTHRMQVLSRQRMGIDRILDRMQRKEWPLRCECGDRMLDVRLLAGSELCTGCAARREIPRRPSAPVRARVMR
ncbi:hypothetical protein HYV74_02920 [Candidatus Uhrbacteria bacterium]|nr:hypothetical protein [Candidatus Uhrbacteria bacterium]